MNQAELVAKVAEGSGLSRRRARSVVDAALAEISRSLARGERVTLSGFGTFDVHQASERVGRHPRTGEKLLVPTRRVVVFRSGRDLQAAVAPGSESGVQAGSRPNPPSGTPNGIGPESLEEQGS